MQQDQSMKIRFMSQKAAKHVLQRTGILAKVEGMRKMWIKRDMNKEERIERVESRGPVKKQGENTGTNEEINLESCGHESEEMVAQRCHGRSPSGSLKIMYANIDDWC